MKPLPKPLKQLPHIEPGDTFRLGDIFVLGVGLGSPRRLSDWPWGRASIAGARHVESNTRGSPSTGFLPLGNTLRLTNIFNVADWIWADGWIGFAFWGRFGQGPRLLFYDGSASMMTTCRYQWISWPLYKYIIMYHCCCSSFSPSSTCCMWVQLGLCTWFCCS